MSKLLVVVDYQKDFVDGALGYPGAEALEGPLHDKVKAALADGWKVIFTRDTPRPRLPRHPGGPFPAGAPLHRGQRGLAPLRQAGRI